MAHVLLTRDARKQLDGLPVAIHLRVLRVLERLAEWPDVSGAKPLRGNFAKQFRVRTGDYRVQFFPQADKIIVSKIGHRDGFYDE